MLQPFIDVFLWLYTLVSTDKVNVVHITLFMQLVQSLVCVAWNVRLLYHFLIAGFVFASIFVSSLQRFPHFSPPSPPSPTVPVLHTQSQMIRQMQFLFQFELCAHGGRGE